MIVYRGGGERPSVIQGWRATLLSMLGTGLAIGAFIVVGALALVFIVLLLLGSAIASIVWPLLEGLRSLKLRGKGKPSSRSEVIDAEFEVVDREEPPDKRE